MKRLLISRFSISCFWALALMSVASCAFGAEHRALLNDSWSLGGVRADNASIRKTDGGVLVISIRAASERVWDIQVVQTIQRAVPRDDRLVFSFRARSATGNAMRVEVEQVAEPYNSVAELMPTLTPKWVDYKMEGISPGYGPNELGVHFQVAKQAGTIELADIHLTDLGTDPAIAEANAAIAPAAIAARIDRYRKRTLSLHIVDAAGHAIPDAHVEVMQTRHAFLFGCNLFGLKVHDTGEGQAQYQSRFAALFNYATLPFYWGSYEPVRGHAQEQSLKEMAFWCRDHHITAKGHPLVYHIVYPKWAPTDADSTIPLLHARIDNLVKSFAGTVSVWDVINEANSAAANPITGIGSWIGRDGAAHVVGTVLQWAREADPGHHDTFLYNDFKTDGENIAMLQALADHHELPDAIGIQSHMHGPNWDLWKVWSTAQDFAVFRRPIHFTETTVLSGEHRGFPSAPGPDATDWLSTPAGEKEQADYVVKFYSILFSHPSLRAITWWDFSDQHAWLGAPSGLLRKDMTPKPAYAALMKLIHHDWWTHEHLASDAGGNCQVRAFCGDYSIIVTDGNGHLTEKQITLPLSGPESQLFILSI